MVLFDTTMLALLFNPSAAGAIPEARGRVGRYAKELERRRERILVPTPALSELLVVLEESGSKVLERLARSSTFSLAGFDERAAIEVAVLTREAIRSGDKRGGSSAPWQKVKIDRQIVAIARVHGARAVCTDDADMRRFAIAAGLEASGSADLPDPEPTQRSMFGEDDDE